MTGGGLYACPYQPLDLTPDQKTELHDTANELMDKFQTQYQTHIDDNSSTFNSARWELLRECDGIRVYHDYRSRAGITSGNLHRLIAIGSIAGTLSDAMYGEFNHTATDMRVKTVYVKDTVVDCAVLDTILEPTDEDPFQSMTVRLLVKSVPLYLRPVTRHRDNVYLEATGFRRLATGESVGFHLMHSISSPKTPALPSFDRTNVSICTMWRELRAQRVHVFRTAYVEVAESSVIVPLALRSTADAIISVQRVVDCALHKKLLHIVQSKATAELHESFQSTTGEGCFVCRARIRPSRRDADFACAACRKTTCKQCRVKRKLVFVDQDQALQHRTMRFCIPCLLSATQLDATAIARAELRAETISKDTDWLSLHASGRWTSRTSSLSLDSVSDLL